MAKNVTNICIVITLSWLLFYLLFNAHVATYMILFVSGFITTTSAIIQLYTVGSKLHNKIIFSFIGMLCIVLLWIGIGMILPAAIIIISILLAGTILFMRSRDNGGG